MKKQYLFVIILLFSFAAYSQSVELVYSNEELKITKLENNMWVIETSDMTTMYIVEGSKRAILIDTGTKCSDLDKIVRKITKKPLDVVVTHYHPDHAGNVKFFDEIYYHAEDTVLTHGAFDMEPYNGTVHFIDDGYTFDLGETKLEVVYTPGHTPGSICLIDRKSGNCYSGDAFGSGGVWLQVEPQLPVKTYVASCEKMINLMEEGSVKRIYCGHYPYSHQVYDINYVKSMKNLGESLVRGTGLKDAVLFKNPRYTDSATIPSVVIDSIQQTMIVFYPDKI